MESDSKYSTDRKIIEENDWKPKKNQKYESVQKNNEQKSTSTKKCNTVISSHRTHHIN